MELNKTFIVKCSQYRIADVFPKIDQLEVCSFDMSPDFLCVFIRPQEEPTTWTGYFGKVLMASTTYLPAQVTEMFTQGRAFATVRLPFSGHKNICALAT